MDKSEILREIRRHLSESTDVVSGKVYGSWLFDHQAVDCDVAIMMPSVNGIVANGVYARLQDLRESMVRATGHDIDLVPHTEDELTDARSPLWYPRYNPSLVFGETVKGSFDVHPVTKRCEVFSFADLTLYVLYDNRTVCRRQLLRSLDGESGRIFVSKLRHGAGNALTRHACETGIDYLCSTSDLNACMHAFDKIYSVDSRQAIRFFHRAAPIGFQDACRLMRWYESLIATVLNRSQAPFYQEASDALLP